MKDPIDRFARAQASRLFKKLARQVRRAIRRQDEEAIHDLRVAIRRLSQCRREFRQFFPRRRTDRLLKQLSRIMDMAAEMRNRDIAIQLIGNPKAAVVAGLEQEREQARRKLVRRLERWRRSDFS